MSDTDARVEAYYAKAKRWRQEMLALRAILLDSGLREEFKWRSACYTHDGGNVATVWGLKNFCGLSFFKGVLLRDPKGILVAPGDNSRSVRMVRFTSVADIVAMEATLKDYVRAAIEVEKSGQRVDFAKDDLAYPAELTRALDDDPRLKAAFAALTPGRRRGYVLHFGRPLQAKTRTARIGRCAPRILAGKGMHDR